MRERERKRERERERECEREREREGQEKTIVTCVHKTVIFVNRSF